MGLFICFDCNEDSKIDDKNEERTKDNNQDIQISIRDLSGTIVSPSVLYNKIFEKNPLDDYKIIKEISNSKNEVVLKEDSEGKVFIMEKISEYNKDINILKEILNLDHQDIIKIYYIYIYSNCYYIIYDKTENNILKEDKIDFDLKYRKEIMEKLFNTINYLHEQKIYNIGLNFDNLILNKIELKHKKKILRKRKQSSKDIDSDKPSVAYIPLISIIDILKLNYDNSLIQFYSPEIINQIYVKRISQKEINNINDKNDEWSCGIILYYLITGDLPFEGDCLHDFYVNLDKTLIDISSPKFNNSNDSEKDLLLKLLEKDKNKRISIAECLKHPYISETSLKSESKDILEDDIDIDILKSLFNIQKPASKLHEVVIAYLCYNFISEEEKNKINYLFNYIDSDKDNKITEEDLIRIFDKKEIKYTPEQIQHILYVFDYDLNNKIQYQEFSRHICNKKELFKEENMRKLFNSIDVNKNKFIDQQDILGFILSDDNITEITIEKEFMEKFGMNVNDKITYEEFCDAIRNNKLIDKKNKNESINDIKIEEE